MKRTVYCQILIAIFSLVFIGENVAQEAPKSFLQEGIMQEFPSKGDALVTKSNWLEPPFNRYAFQHISEFHNTLPVYRGSGKISKLGYNTLDLDGITYKNQKKQTRSFRQMLTDTYTDAIVILHNGKIVYEKYFNGQTPEQQHIIFSCTKSLVGTVAAKKAHEGILNPDAMVIDYIPELKNSGYSDATVRQVMDMTTGIIYSEKYADPNSEVVKHMVATNYRFTPDGYTGPETLCDFLAELKKRDEHGEHFEYVSGNTEVLAWLVKRATGKSVVDIFSDEIWQHLGAERDGYILSDRASTASWGGGFNTIARDMARFGLMMLNNGQANGVQCVPAEVVEDIRNSLTQKEFEQYAKEQIGNVLDKWSYRNQWWVSHNEHGAYTAIGIYGQFIYVDPAANMVIAKQSSFLSATDDLIDYDPFVAFHEVAKFLKSLNDK